MSRGVISGRSDANPGSSISATLALAATPGLHQAMQQTQFNNAYVGHLATSTSCWKQYHPGASASVQCPGVNGGAACQAANMLNAKYGVSSIQSQQQAQSCHLVAAASVAPAASYPAVFKSHIIEQHPVCPGVAAGAVRPVVINQPPVHQLIPQGSSCVHIQTVPSLHPSPLPSQAPPRPHSCDFTLALQKASHAEITASESMRISTATKTCCDSGLNRILSLENRSSSFGDLVNVAISMAEEAKQIGSESRTLAQQAASVLESLKTNVCHLSEGHRKTSAIAQEAADLARQIDARARQTEASAQESLKLATANKITIEKFSQDLTVLRSESAAIRNSIEELRRTVDSTLDEASAARADAAKALSELDSARKDAADARCKAARAIENAERFESEIKQLLGKIDSQLQSNIKTTREVQSVADEALRMANAASNASQAAQSKAEIAFQEATGARTDSKDALHLAEDASSEAKAASGVAREIKRMAEGHQQEIVDLNDRLDRCEKNTEAVKATATRTERMLSQIIDCIASVKSA